MKPPSDPESALVAGVHLARRDPVLARALPVSLWRQRDALDPARLRAAARTLGEKRALGFFLDLTSDLSGDRRFTRWSRPLKDRRVRADTPFFHLPTPASGAPARSFPAAHRWHYTLTADLASFRTLFDKFAERA